MGPGAPPIRRPSVPLIRLQISGVSVMRNRDWNGDGFTAAQVSELAQAGVAYRGVRGKPRFSALLSSANRACLDESTGMHAMLLHGEGWYAWDCAVFYVSSGNTMARSHDN
jgi:hypothetical protein